MDEGISSSFGFNPLILRLIKFPPRRFFVHVSPGLAKRFYSTVDAEGKIEGAVNVLKEVFLKHWTSGAGSHAFL